MVEILAEGGHTKLRKMCGSITARSVPASLRSAESYRTSSFPVQQLPGQGVDASRTWVPRYALTSRVEQAIE
jgi:hypothetical protein